MIQATERGAPKGRKPIEWKLVTDLPTRTRSEAVEKIDWYAMRWKMEVFHKILKSGCLVESPNYARLIGWPISWRFSVFLSRASKEPFAS